MNIYEKEIYSNLILTIEHFTFYKKKIYVSKEVLCGISTHRKKYAS
jgi:hypothetical protein